MVCNIEVLECLLVSGMYGGKYIRRFPLEKFLADKTDGNHNSVRKVTTKLMNAGRLNFYKIKNGGNVKTYLTLSNKILDKHFKNIYNPSFYKTKLYELSVKNIKKYGFNNRKIPDRKLLPPEDLIILFPKEVRTKEELEEMKKFEKYD